MTTAAPAAPAPDFAFEPLPGLAPAAASAPDPAARPPIRPAPPAREYCDGYLPDGTPLQFTVDRLAIYRDAIASDGAEHNGRPASLSDALVILYLSAHHQSVYETPRPAPGGGLLLPLRAVAWEMLHAISLWGEKTLRVSEEHEIIRLGQQLWDWHHDTAVYPVDNVKKKPGSLRTPPVSPSPMETPPSAGSSPVETSPDGTTSAATPPCGTSTAPSTVTTSAPASPAPPQPPQPQPTTPSQTDSTASAA